MAMYSADSFDYVFGVTRYTTFVASAANRKRGVNMKRDRSLGKRGVAVLAGGLSFVGTADATELITDGSFENTTPSSSAVVKVGGKANPGLGGGWSTFSTYLYSTLYTAQGRPGLVCSTYDPIRPASRESHRAVIPSRNW